VLPENAGDDKPDSGEVVGDGVVLLIYERAA
jgi:hypothetical protein